MDFKKADSFYNLKPNGKYINVIEKSSNKALGKIYLEGSHLNELKRSNYSFFGLKNYITSLDKLSVKIPITNFEMLFGKEFSDSAKVINLIRKKLNSKNNNVLTNKSGDILDLIKLEIKSVNKNQYGYYEVEFCLKYKGRQWTNHNLLKNENVSLITLLTSLFSKASISNDSFDNFVTKTNNYSSEDCKTIWERSNLVKERLLRLFGNDFKEIESLLIRYVNN